MGDVRGFLEVVVAFVVVVEVVVEVDLAASSPFHCQRFGNKKSDTSFFSGLSCHCQKFGVFNEVDSV